MSSYSHRGYEHRSGGYGRRRRKTMGFKKRKRTGNFLKILITIICAAIVVGLLVIFFKYLQPFVESFIPNDGKEDSDAAAVTETFDVPDGNYDSVDSKIFVSDGSGYVMFNGIDETASNYAAIINSAVSTIDSDVEVYNMVVPTNTEFGLEPYFSEETYSQRSNLDKISSGLKDSIINIDVYDTLNAHKDEYIYFRTDESWTTLGAYYAFTDFANLASFPQDKVYTLDDMAAQKGIIKRFEGSYIQRTSDEETQPNGNEELAANADYIEFYKLNVNYVCYSINMETGSEEEIELFSIDNVGSDPLSVFPGSTTSLLRIINHDCSNGERLLVVKDSFADPMIGYLVPGYSQVHVVDAQLYEKNLSEYIRSNDITQVLFLSSVTDANNSLYCQRLRDLFESSVTG